MSSFNEKIFNGEAFGKYVDTIPKIKQNAFLSSGILKRESKFKSAFSAQSGSSYMTIPMFGRIGGKASNYDGKTNIGSNRTDTFSRSVITIGRAKAWLEDDFSEDITGGVSFMSNVARQVSDYWEDVDQETLVAILKGIFSMTGSENESFVNNHTYDITEVGQGLVTATSLNNAIQKACAANKNKFKFAIMHSAVATNLENMNLLEYMKYTDSMGIQRDLSLATWNGRTVLIDDDATIDTTSLLSVSEDSDARTKKAKGLETKYITYLLGEGAFDYENVGVKVPYEMSRDPKTNGGQTVLYTRQRKVFAPYGISFTKQSMVTDSPTDEELSQGQNWTLVSNHDKSATIDHKAIPIARIISKG